MTCAKIALLPDRGVVSLRGPDAEKLLQGVITNDMELVTQDKAIHAALLTPQGKILFEFLSVGTADGYLVETGREQASGLAKRLAMYKLRAKVDIEDVSADYRIFAAWGSAR